MGRYFGTDGVRGRANEQLTLEMAIKIGQYMGYYYSQKHKKAKILIGKDTRLSGDMFELALAAGATSMGANAYLLGVCPTPAISYLVQKERFDCGIMVSASHNPYYDNGIKLFNHEGEKMEESLLAQVEDYMDGLTSLDYATGEAIGEYIDWHDGLEIYISWLKSVHQIDLSGLSILCDLANGSATSTVIETLSSLGATVEALHNSPNGLNINRKAGSTHPERLCERLKEGDYDLGLAFDGDADRLILADEDGKLIDGDYILYIVSKYLKSKGSLVRNTCVTTVMANLGLYKALEANGIDTVQTPVGDKYVYEEMVKNGYLIGGEQSGHIIFYQYERTGDGLFTALQILQIMKETGKSLKSLCQGLFIYPQLLENVPVNDKDSLLTHPRLVEAIEKVQTDLAGNGRILVRPSGTEQLIRVMVEAESDQACQRYVSEVVQVVKELENAV